MMKSSNSNRRLGFDTSECLGKLPPLRGKRGRELRGAGLRKANACPRACHVAHKVRSQWNAVPRLECAQPSLVGPTNFTPDGLLQRRSQIYSAPTASRVFRVVVWFREQFVSFLRVEYESGSGTLISGWKVGGGGYFQ